MVQTIQPRSQATLYGRSCSICSHAELSAIDAGLVAQTPITQLAQQHGVSRDSLYRHLHWHLRPVVRRAITSTPDTRPVALVERIARIANDARDAAHVAYASGNAQLGARLGDAELRALDSLADRFNVTHDDVSADRAKVAQVSRAVSSALDASPELAARVADALEADGHIEIAQDIRDAIPAHVSGNEGVSA